MRRHEWTGLLAGTLALCLGTAIACGTDDEAAKEGGCSYSYECDVGQICKAGACVSAAPLEEGRGGSGGTGGTGGGTGGSGGTTGVGGSGGVGGAGGTSAERPTFAPDGFRRCFDSLECAVFGGDCVVELTLSRPLADGSERIALADLDPSLAPGQGLCAVACTNEPRVCDSVVISGPDGESAPSTCQLVFAGESPYPADAPPFPFDRLLDPAALERGVPFAAICRPPFQFAKRHSPSFCQACAVAGDCGPGDACWLEGAYAAPPFGSCVQACTEAKDCPFGFTCTDVGAESVLLAGRPGRYCIPFEDTCGRCLDMDGNQRGVGTCGPVDEPNTAVDCDDSNAAAYFDAVNPAHAFPAFCGEHDFNCNGVSDRAEQLGTPAHCAECGDVCAGRVANGDRACQPVEGTGGFACVAVCAAGYADCNGEVADGCEAELQPHMVWARDADGDGRGSRLKLRYFCAGAAEPGWVQNMLDCNDEAAHVYGGGLDTAGASVGAAPELCDGVDNDCNNRVDDATVVVEGGVVIAAAGDDCASGHAGVCAAGTLVCAGAGTTAAAMTCVPDLDPAVRATVAESCNGLDDDCDGTVDEEVDWFRDMGVANPGNAPATCAIPGGVGVCAQGVYGCLADGEGGAAWSCIGNQPSATDAIGDGIDSNCDGVDGDLSAAIFVRRNVSGGELEGNDLNDGSAQRPVATLQRALDLACAGGIHPCRDVYLESFSFVSAQPVRIPLYAGSSVDAHVRIYGGFQPTPVGCDAPSGCTLQWTRADRRTTLVRKAPARIAGASPFGSIYAALQSASGTGSVSLLVDQVDVEVESPDLADVLTAGQHAPTQVGLHCMAGGCSHLELTNVTITVQDAIDGGAGTEGAMAEVLTADANGRDADQHGNTTDTGIHSPAAGGTASACAGGVRPHGGSAGGYRIDNGGGSRIYAFIGTGGSGSSGGAAGCRAWRRSGECSANTRESVCGTTAQPGRGGNGARGSGGSWSGTRQLRLQLAGGVLAPSDGVSVSAPSRGGYGSGGGGGAGCMSHGGCVGSAPFYCQHANAQGVDVYGSGGGAGGCGGESGQNGGNGGNSVGMILTPPASGDLRFVVDDARPFLLLVGNAGKGGNGGNGGKGAGGGWAGSLNSGVGWINSNAGYYVGGNGGDGAGGGGGAGGLGGFSIGFWQHCTRTGGGATGTCGVELPGRVRAQPYDYVQVGSGGAGGAKGRGGAAGAKTPAQGKSDAGAGNNGGTDGQDGIGGVAHALYRS